MQLQGPLNTALGHRSKPPTPPSRSAEQGEAKRAPFLRQLKDTLTCLPFLGILLMNAMIMATFLSFSTLTQQILCSVGYSDVRSPTLLRYRCRQACLAAHLHRS